MLAHMEEVDLFTLEAWGRRSDCEGGKNRKGDPVSKNSAEEMDTSSDPFCLFFRRLIYTCSVCIAPFSPY